MNYGASAAWVFARIATFSETDPLATADYFMDAQGRTDWKLDIANPEQSDSIMSLVEQGLKDGALGIGVNAGYAPGYGHKEYCALAELAKKYNVPTYTHVRYASNTEPQSSFEAIQELISLAATTGAHMHLCHINSTSLSDIKATMALVEEAQAKGINITTEAYPFGAAMFSGPDWRSKMDSTANNFQLGGVGHGFFRQSGAQFLRGRGVEHGQQERRGLRRKITSAFRKTLTTGITRENGNGTT
jgi:N-acyl-D-glutamate deacylase